MMKGRRETAHLENILQIDVEDWYCNFDIDDWEFYEDRVVSSTSKVLDILQENHTHATFYILGYVAERHPELVLRIQFEGHEIGTHGYAHKSILKQNPDEFEEDLTRSIQVLGKILGGQDKILGYRAPQFSVTCKTSWVIDILKRVGLKYDSSIFPARTQLYGVSDAPRFPYHISSSNIQKDDTSTGFLEIPLSVYKVPGVPYRVPIAGGFYLRFFPYSFTRNALRHINEQNQSAVCYLHPWELDPEQPRVSSLSWYHYWQLSSTESKFRRLLKDFKFTSVSRKMNFTDGKTKKPEISRII